jgi:hypothetical protein
MPTSSVFNKFRMFINYGLKRVEWGQKVASVRSSVSDALLFESSLPRLP